MNNKARQAVASFFQNVSSYIKAEYKPRFYKLYNREDIVDDMIRLTNEYYWGGNTVQNTAGDVVDLLRSKYGK